MITLRGSSWAHTRGYLPMVATAQRYEETHPDVRIVWEKRSLLDFEKFPIKDLAARYDLMVIDHPFIGHAARDRIFLPLDDYLPPEFLVDQAAHSVGGSHSSYNYDGKQWALAIDAATPVAAWRSDLLAKAGLAVPTTWAEVIALARSGRVEVPGDPVNCLMNFLGLCVSAGEAPFTASGHVVEAKAGLQALAWLHELHAACDPASFGRNPIHSLDLLSSAANEKIAYCLFPYGYSTSTLRPFRGRPHRQRPSRAGHPGLPRAAGHHRAGWPRRDQPA
jgi:multiple sugar transport system substrate-binding protein